MPFWTLAKKASTLGSSQYAAAVSDRISSGHEPEGMVTARFMIRCSSQARFLPRAEVLCADSTLRSFIRVRMHRIISLFWLEAFFAGRGRRACGLGWALSCIRLLKVRRHQDWVTSPSARSSLTDCARSRVRACTSSNSRTFSDTAKVLQTFKEKLEQCDVVTDGEAKARSLANGLCREERIKHDCDEKHTAPNHCYGCQYEYSSSEIVRLP
jgi:hypothetical protein